MIPPLIEARILVDLWHLYKELEEIDFGASSMLQSLRYDPEGQLAFAKFQATGELWVYQDVPQSVLDHVLTEAFKPYGSGGHTFYVDVVKGEPYIGFVLAEKDNPITWMIDRSAANE